MYLIRSGFFFLQVYTQVTWVRVMVTERQIYWRWRAPVSVIRPRTSQPAWWVLSSVFISIKQLFFQHDCTGRVKQIICVSGNWTSVRKMESPPKFVLPVWPILTIAIYKSCIEYVRLQIWTLTDPSNHWWNVVYIMHNITCAGIIFIIQILTG